MKTHLISVSVQRRQFTPGTCIRIKGITVQKEDCASTVLAYLSLALLRCGCSPVTGATISGVEAAADERAFSLFRGKASRRATEHEN